ncbi:MAG: hypothetical protein M1818_005802 [Claussenomyces sp. TS43310]|nr:MAG: hypothetical protein M1818_005802 [Claussenomyces sp. TS43310]
MTSGTADDLPPCTVHHYGSHDLQTLSVWHLPTPTTSEPKDERYWIIFIHGGAWRDPAITSASFEPTLRHLLASPTTAAHTRGLASLNYRLSAHPAHPQDPAQTPRHALRNATHPAHIRDVRAALSFLQRRHGLGARYLLVGHSCGATLALQSVMDPSRLFGEGEGEGEGEGDGDGDGDGPPRADAAAAEVVGQGAADGLLVPPAAIVGIAGIYDLRLLRDNHARVPVYAAFLTAAFGPRERVWDRVSPACDEGLVRGWAGAAGAAAGSRRRRRLLVVAHSRDDELVEEEQARVLVRAVRGDGQGAGDVEVVALVGERGLTGSHDELWEQGSQIAHMIGMALSRLVGGV